MKKIKKNGNRSICLFSFIVVHSCNFFFKYNHEPDVIINSEIIIKSNSKISFKTIDRRIFISFILFLSNRSKRYNDKIFTCHHSATQNIFTLKYHQFCFGFSFQSLCMKFCCQLKGVQLKFFPVLL